MKKHEHVEYWLKSAANDLKAADTLFKSAKYDAPIENPFWTGANIGSP